MLMPVPQAAPERNGRPGRRGKMAHNPEHMPDTSRVRPIRVILSEDHELVRACLRVLLDAQPDIEVVGEAGDAAATVSLVGQMHPDVVIVDLMQPRGGGSHAISRIAARWPSVRILVLTALAQAQAVSQALAAGATGYLLKTCDRVALLNAVRSVAAGGVYLSPEASSVLVESYRAAPAPPPGSESRSLAERERRVLALLAEGLNSEQIAVRLGVSTRTVAKCRAEIAAKTGLRGIAELTRLAIAEGLAPAGPVPAGAPASQLPATAGQ